MEASLEDAEQGNGENQICDLEFKFRDQFISLAQAIIIFLRERNREGVEPATWVCFLTRN